MWGPGYHLRASGRSVTYQNSLPHYNLRSRPHRRLNPPSLCFRGVSVAFTKSARTNPTGEVRVEPVPPVQP